MSFILKQQLNTIHNKEGAMLEPLVNWGIAVKEVLFARIPDFLTLLHVHSTTNETSTKTVAF